jgi:TraG P-loop domain
MPVFPKPASGGAAAKEEPMTVTKPLFDWLPTRHLGSVQEHYVGALEVCDDVLVLATAQRAKPAYCTIIDAGSINYLLLSGKEQADILEAYRAFVTALSFPCQILIQVSPLDLRPYITETRERASYQEGTIWPTIAEGHVQFVQTLSQQRTFLERHFYVVIPYERDFERRRQGMIRRLTSAAEREQAFLQLRLRADKVQRDLERIGLHGRRLMGDELAQVYARAIAPERAQMKPFTDELLQSTGRLTAYQEETPSNLLVPQKTRSPKPRKTQKVPSLFADIADSVAPTSIQLAPDHLVIDGQYVRALYISHYPRYVHAGWLARLIDHDLPMDVALHLAPRDTVAMIHRFQRKSDELTASQRIAERNQGRVNVEAAIALSDISQTIERLQRGDEKIVDFALYITIRAASLETLGERTAQVEAVLESVQIATRTAMFEQDRGYRCCVPEAQDHLHRGYEQDTGSVTMAFPFVSHSLSMATGVLYGTAPNGSPIILDPFSAEMENANEVIFAKSGAGKSYHCKTMLTRLMARGVQAFVIDPEDEYRTLAEAVNGQVIDLSVSGTAHMNPFDLPDEEITAQALAEKIQGLQALLDLMLADRTPTGATVLSQAEKGLLDKALHQVYRDAPERGRESRMGDLYDVLKNAQTGPDETHLADRLYRYVHGSLAGLLNQPTTIESRNQLVVFNLKGLDDEVQPLALYLIADYVWTRINRERRPRMLLIDEAWMLMQFAEGARFLSGLARRARKYWLAIVTITQSVGDFLSSEYGQAILQNASMKLLMKQDSATIDAVVQAFALSPQERHALLGAPVGSGILFARGTHVQLTVRASQAEHQLATSNPSELAARRTLVSGGVEEE